MSDLVERLRKRADIRRQISTRKSVQEGKPDRISDLLEEAALELERVEAELAGIRGAQTSRLMKERDAAIARAEKAEYGCASLRMELDGLELVRKRDNQHLLDREAAALAEVARLREALTPALVESALVVETILATDEAKPYAELGPDLRSQIVKAATALRVGAAALAATEPKR